MFLFVVFVLSGAGRTHDFCNIKRKHSFNNQINTFAMFPFFVALLIQLGLLLSPEQWNTLTESEQQRLEIFMHRSTKMLSITAMRLQKKLSF
jgi:hypothetical protein